MQTNDSGHVAVPAETTDTSLTDALRLVPIEPTDAMIKVATTSEMTCGSGDEEIQVYLTDGMAAELFRLMVNAAPPAKSCAIVPFQPTQEMLDAADDASVLSYATGNPGLDLVHTNVYRAMIAAAPAAFADYLPDACFCSTAKPPCSYCEKHGDDK